VVGDVWGQEGLRHQEGVGLGGLGKERLGVWDLAPPRPSSAPQPEQTSLLPASAGTVGLSEVMLMLTTPTVRAGTPTATKTPTTAG
jgi:hypothetical protein